MPRTKHMLSKSFAYASWNGMRERCHNPKSVSYPNYGAKGITVCKQWKTFENFYADMGERPEGYSIDRIDSKGNYEPGNCRWATDAEQNANKSNVKIHTAFGETACVAEHARMSGVGRYAIDYRLAKGLSMEQALVKPNGAMMKPKATQCLRGHAYAEHAKLGNDGAYHCRECAKISRKRKTVRVDAKQYQDLLDAHLKMRDKLMEICKQCHVCDGTGLTSVRPQDEAVWGRTLPCAECEDLRELLA